MELIACVITYCRSVYENPLAHDDMALVAKLRRKICTQRSSPAFLANPEPGLCFRGCKIALEESYGLKSESLFHMLC